MQREHVQRKKKELGLNNYKNMMAAKRRAQRLAKGETKNPRRELTEEELLKKKEHQRELGRLRAAKYRASKKVNQ